MRGQPFCFWHHPDHKTEAAEARRLGGLRRRREKTLEGAYDLHEGFRSVDGILRFVEIGAIDLLGLDTSVARSNAMFRGALAAAKLLEVGDHERRLAAAEAALATRQPDSPSPLRCRSRRDRFPLSIPSRSARDRRPRGTFPELSSFKRRVDGLDDNLSPTDIVLRWLQEVACFPSADDYVASIKDRPSSAWPLHRLTQEAERAATASSKGLPRDTIDRKVREAVRDVVFFVHLHLKLSSRIYDELRVASPSLALLVVDLNHRMREDARGSDAALAWMRACHELPYPLDAETAVAVEAALEHRVESWSLVREAETVEEWVLEMLSADDDDSDGEVAGLARGVERELRRLVGSNVVRAGRLVTLPAVPIPFFASAPLLEGAWIDLTVLELAESGTILADQGCTLRGSGDVHLLASEEFVRTDAQGEQVPIDETTWREARKSAGARVGRYRGGRRRFGGRTYVKFALYQRWRARTLGSRLEASTESGFVAESWNDWVKRQGPKAALAGVPVEPLTPLVDRDMWTVHDADLARGLQTNRANLLANLRSSALSEKRTTAGADAGVSWEIQATSLLVLIEGLASSVDTIRATYFRNHEILYPDLADFLDSCRNGIRTVLSLFEAERDGDDSWLLRFGSPPLQPDDDDVAADEDDPDLKRIKARISRTGARTVKDLLLRARFEALVFIGEREAARVILDQELDELLS